MDSQIDTNNENFYSVIEKLKTIYELKSDRKLSLKLDVLPASFSNSKKRGILPYEKIITAAIKDKISLDEIFGNRINNKIDYTNLKDKKANKHGLVDIPMLNDNLDYIRVPLIYLENTTNLKGYISNNHTYILNTSEIKPEHNRTYLLTSNNIYYIKHISIDLSGTYLLKDEDGSITNINKNELDNVIFIGRVEHKFSRTSLV